MMYPVDEMPIGSFSPLRQRQRHHLLFGPCNTSMSLPPPFNLALGTAFILIQFEISWKLICHIDCVIVALRWSISGRRTQYTYNNHQRWRPIRNNSHQYKRLSPNDHQCHISKVADHCRHDRVKSAGRSPSMYSVELGRESFDIATVSNRLCFFRFNDF